MRPRLVRLDIRTIGEANVNRIKRDDQIFVVIDLFECLYDAGFLTDCPGKGFMGDAVAQAHTLFVDVGKMIFVEGGWVVSFEAEVAGKSECFISLLYNVSSLRRLLTIPQASHRFDQHISKPDHGAQHH